MTKSTPPRIAPNAGRARGAHGPSSPIAIPELLAPAGSIETFRAAFEAGADAFYLGYGDFNARRRAKNFTEEELRLAAAYAHQHGRKIYVTLNTLSFERELFALLDLLELVQEIGADAVIIQDLGTLSLLREQFPELPVHASTQTFCHNSLHAKFLVRNGVSRIILPRELSFEEISTMMQRAPTEYEVFVHGAMCFSFSGCCLASSWLHGESGNRGRCLQVCRHAFHSGDGKCHPFSMRDLNALELVEDLVGLGVSSLKIEGRLKSAEYVYETVSAYRGVLDAIRDGRRLRELPEVPRQRETSSGYFRGDPDYHRLVQPRTSGTSGRVFGEALVVSRRTIEIGLEGEPFKGLRLRVQDSLGRNLHEGTLLDFSRDKRQGQARLIWRLEQDIDPTGFRAPFTVYSLGKSAPSDTLGFLRSRVKKIVLDHVGVEAEVRGGSIRIRASSGARGFSFEREYSLATEVSKTRPLTEEDCARILAQTDTLPYAVEAVSCRIEEDLFCPLGALKEARRRFYAEFHAAFLERMAELRRSRREELIVRLDAIRDRRLTDAPPASFRIAGSTPHSAEDRTELVVHPITLEQDPEAPPTDRTLLLLPLFVPQAAVEDWTRRLRVLAERGYTRFMAPTYGWLSLRGELPGAEFVAGSYCYAVNPLAVDLLEREGVRSFVLSPDISEEDAGAVARFSGRLLAEDASREMFVTRLEVPPGEYRLKGRRFEARRFPGYTVIEEG